MCLNVGGERRLEELRRAEQGRGCLLLNGLCVHVDPDSGGRDKEPSLLPLLTDDTRIP